MEWVSGLALQNQNSIRAKTGDISPLVNRDKCECLILVNQDKSQYLEMHHENGGGKNSYDIFTVGFLSPHKIGSGNQKTTGMSRFATENGIQLDLKEDDFLKTYNKNKFRVEYTKGRKLYSFRNENETYLAQYYFVKGNLVEFRFGYDNS